MKKLAKQKEQAEKKAAKGGAAKGQKEEVEVMTKRQLDEKRFEADEEAKMASG